MRKNKIIIIAIIILVLLIALVPLFLQSGAEFGGSDEAGSAMVREITGREQAPWFTPVIERLTGGELSREMETLFFCIQTGIGVGILAFCFGYLVARKKYLRK